MTQHSNAKSKTPKGKPSGSQRGGDGLKDVIHNEKTTSSIEEKYLDQDGQPDKNVNTRHQNRNTQ